MEVVFFLSFPASPVPFFSELKDHATGAAEPVACLAIINAALSASNLDAVGDAGECMLAAQALLGAYACSAPSDAPRAELAAAAAQLLSTAGSTFAGMPLPAFGEVLTVVLGASRAAQEREDEGVQAQLSAFVGVLSAAATEEQLGILGLLVRRAVAAAADVPDAAAG